MSSNIDDQVYSSWLGKDEEIMLDVTTCAMAFRLLRMNGYDVSSGAFEFWNLILFHIGVHLEFLLI